MIVLRQRTYSAYDGLTEKQKKKLRKSRNAIAKELKAAKRLAYENIEKSRAAGEKVISTGDVVFGEETGHRATVKSEGINPGRGNRAVADKVRRNAITKLQLAGRRVAISEKERVLGQPQSEGVISQFVSPSGNYTSSDKVEKLAASKGIVSKIKANPKTTAGIVAGTALTAAGGAYLYNRAKKRDPQEAELPEE